MITQVEIFKTNVIRECDAADLAGLLALHLPHCQVNFDLDDCDRIVRVESAQQEIHLSQIIQLMNKQGYTCTPLI